MSIGKMKNVKKSFSQVVKEKRVTLTSPPMWKF